MNLKDDLHEELYNELSLYKMMVNAALDSITLIDRDYTYRIVTDAYLGARQLKKEHILNHTVKDVWGKQVFDQSIKENLDKCFSGETVSTRASYEFKKNEINYIETTYTPCFTSGSEISFAAVISRNITELKKSQEKIAFLAYYDSLTNLPSRPLFLDLLNREIINAKRTDKSVAVFFFDLDEFKKINDTFGHTAGDNLLVSVGKRLKRYLRPSDILSRMDRPLNLDKKHTENYLARIGGDEFTFIIPDLTDKKVTTGIAERILSLFKEPFQIEDREIFISTSIGIAFYPDDGNDVEALLKNADIAMYKAKDVGKNTFRYYSSDMNEKAKERINIENKMRYAIKNNVFQLYYQPQYSIEDSKLIGMEALIRWEDEDLGFISPTELIQLAEETGMIIDIGDWALHSACRQGKIWHDQGFDKLHMGVNLSVRQFFDLNLTEKIRSAIETTNFDPSSLELEITETAMMFDTDRAIMIMDEIKNMGVKVALDDFGTGYSSLIHLKLFQIDKLKIDQVFIRNADLEGRDGAIISSIIDMCHKLNIEAVAEGVETKESLKFLKDKECHIAQGFLFSQPLPSEKFKKLLKSSSQAVC
jgi:predicted signal transduction protein with EAL and GGDEF domain